MHDHLAVYLYQTENLYDAYQYLFDKYYDQLILATKAYIKKYYVKSIGLTAEDLNNYCFISFHQAIKQFDYNNCQYEFKQALFIINRSLLRMVLRQLLNNHGHHILNYGYSYDADDKKIKPEFLLVDKIDLNYQLEIQLLYEQFLKFIRYLLLTKTNKNIISIKIFYDRIYHMMKIDEIKDKYQLSTKEVYVHIYMAKKLLQSWIKKLPTTYW
ncbi:MAG: hypothetical protein B1217_0106 [Candidatus Malacoplasma girerdii]|nr:MAG: hypothetical protein B1217_0106 [Candidatus Malacoplasma girerdii]